MDSNITKHNIVGVALMIGLAVFFSFPENTSMIAVKEVVAVQEQNPFPEVELTAKAAYVYDLSLNKELFAKNETAVLPLASLTKIMTAVAAAESAPHTTEVTISPESLGQEGDSGLLSQEKWTLKNLLIFTLVVSSNDGAAAVASALGNESFIDIMNQKAQHFGLTNMKFNNESGLDVSSTTAGAYGTAEEVAKLLGYAVTRHADIFEPTKYKTVEVTSEDDFIHTGINTDIIATQIPGLVGGKTGYSDLAGGNLAIVFDAGIQHPIAVVVLGSTYDGRFEDVQKLVNTAIGVISDNEYNSR